jgi:hypothetical protein
MTLSITDTQHIEADCCISFNIILTFIMLSVVMLNVVAPCKTFLVRLILVGKVKAYLGGAPPYGL